MAENTFILKFDRNTGKLSAKKGLPINILAELLSTLYDAIGVIDKDKITLSEIKDESYGLAFYAEEVLVIENLKIVHNKINEGANTFENRELGYLRVLKKITDSGIYVEAKQEETEYFVRINSIAKADKARLVIEYEEVEGRISEIGGDKILGKRHIKLDEYDNNVFITPDQDDQLKYFYKTDLISFYLRVTKNLTDLEKRKVVELVSFEPKNIKSLKQAIEDFRTEKGDVFTHVIDSAQAVRDLRHNRNTDEA